MTLSAAQGATQNWDNGAANLTWNTTSTNWDAGSVWTNGNDAVFGATGVGTITNAGVTAHNLTFNTTGYTIQSGTLTLNGVTPTIQTATGVTATINSVIDGTAGLTKTGNGTLALGGTNIYTGATTISAGTLQLNGSIAGSATVAAGGTLAGSGTITGTTGVSSGTINGSGLILTGLTTFNGGGNILSGTETATAGVTLAAGAAVTQTGTLTGNLNTTNTGTFTANGTITGNATVAAGGTLAGSGTITGTTGVTSGTINGSGLILTGLTTFNGPGNILSGTETATAGVTLAAGAAVTQTGTLTGNLNTTNTGTFTANGTITGNATVAAGGTLTGSGTITGTTGVTSGTINGSGLILTGLTTFNGPGNILSGTETATAGVTLAAGAAVTQTGTLTGNLNTTNTGTFTANGTITGNATVASGGTLAGSGTVNGNATLTGSGVINKSAGTIGGTLGVTGGNWNGQGSVTGLVTSSSGTFTIGAGANLTANAGLNVTGGSIVAGNDASTITGSVSYTSTTNSSYGGVIAGTGKTLTLNSAGTTLTLTGANTYTGLTTITAGTLKLDRLAADNATISGDLLINGGTLEIAASQQIANTGSIVMTSGAFNFGSASGLTETINNFSNSGGTFTTGANTLHGGGATITWAGGINTVSNGGLVTDSHIVISGGTNTVEGGALGGVLQLNAGGIGLELSNGSTLTLNSDNTVAGKLLLKGDVSTSGNATVTIANAGAFTNLGNIDLYGGTRIFTVADGTAASDLHVGAVITNGALTKEGLGTFVLSSANTYTGATTITNGTLQLDGSTAADSTVDIGTAGSLSGSGMVLGNASLTGGGVIHLTDPGSIAGTLAVTGGHWNGQGKVDGLVTSSFGTFTIGAGANLTAVSGIDITGGSIRADNAASTITGSVNYTSSSDSTFIGVIAGGDKTLTMNGAGATLTLAGANTYTGQTTVTAGTLKLARAAADNATIITDSDTTTTADIVINGGTLEIAASEQIADIGSIDMSSGAFNFGSASGLTETIDSFTNSGGTFTTGANTLHGLGATITWSGGTNTVSDGGLVTDSHIVISGGTNTVEGGAVGGVLQLNAGGTGLEMSNGSTLTLNSDNVVAGKLLLKGDLSTSGNSTVTIANAGAFTNLGNIDLDGGTRTFTVANGLATTDLLVSASITNGALTKQGLGTLELAAANTYNGTTTITNGTLLLTGSLTSPLVNIASGTTLVNQNGGLSAASTVNNSGTLTINNVAESINTLNNSGQIRVVSLVSSGSDTNFFANTINLQSGSTLVLTNSTLLVGQRADIFDGTFTPLSSFSTITGSGLRYGFNYVTGEVQALPNPQQPKSSDTIYNFTKNQTFVVGSAFEDSYTGGPNNKNFYRSDISGNPISSKDQFTWFMDPGTGLKAAAPGTDIAQLEEAVTAIQDSYTLDADGNVVVGAKGLAIANRLSPEVHRGMADYTEQALRTHVREGVDAAPIARSGQTQVFATVHMSTGGAEDDQNEASYDTEMYGATAGVRYDITKDIQIGGLIGADEGNIEGTLVDTDAQGMVFGVFGRYVVHEATKTTLTGSVSYGTFDYDSKRRSFEGSAKADGINSDAFEVALGVRTVSYEKGCFRLIPNATVRYLNGNVDSFVEDSGPGVKLRVDSQDIESLLLDVGVDMEYQVQPQFTLVGNISYVTDFLDDDNDVSAKFAASGDLGRSFSVSAPGIDDEGLVLGLGAYYDINDSSRLGLTYRCDFRKNSETSQTIGLGASFGF